MSIKPITDERLAEIKAVCTGVTKGPWWSSKQSNKHNMRTVHDRNFENLDIQNIDPITSFYIARMDPDTVLAMIARIEAQDKRIADLENEGDNIIEATIDALNEGMDPDMIMLFIQETVQKAKEATPND